MKQKIIAKRNLYLLLTDHLVNTIDSHLTQEELDVVIAYRQELRDLTKQDPDYTKWVFPSEPAVCKSCLYWIGQIIK